MVDIKKFKTLFIFQIVLNSFIALFITLSSYFHLPLVGFKDYFVYGLHFLYLQFCVFGFAYFLTLNKYLFYIIFPPLFFLLAILGFWAYSLDISFSDGILNASLDSKPDIVFDLISLPLLLYLLIICLVIFYILKKYKQLEGKYFNWSLLILAVIAVSLFYFNDYKKETLKSRLPFNVYYEFKSYLQITKHPITKINQKISTNENNVKVILVLGESVRADHLGINGYKRNTTPLLRNQNNLISFKNAFTSKTYTSISLFQILTNQSVYDTPVSETYSLINIINQTGIHTNWIGNQTPENGYLPFITSSRESVIIDPLHSVFSLKKKNDLELLKYIPKPQPSINSFSIFHMIGSHWYYENRYTKNFRHFSPNIKSKYIPSNTPEEMINSYDNTIVLLDYFLNELIEKLKKSNENYILIYVSDHGELLGEEGKWLHAQVTNEKAPKNPALIVWYSDQFKEQFPNKIEKLKGRKNETIPLDYIYHSVLDIYEVDDQYYNKQESLFH